jgi:hypothetical protein
MNHELFKEVQSNCLFMNTQSILASITSFCSDDAESAAEMLTLVKKSVSDSVAELEPLSLVSNSKDAGAIVHRLRFTFSVLGADELLAAAVSIEEAVDEKVVDEYVQDLFEKFKVKFSELNSILKEIQ